MDTVFSVFLSKLADYIVEPVFRQIGYVIQYKSNIRNLNTKVQHLDARRSTVQLEVDAAGKNLETILPEVETWLHEVEVVVREWETRFGEERVSQAWCCNSWCPNPKTCHSLGRKAKKMSIDVENLLSRGDFMIVSCNAPICPRTHEVGTSSGTSKSTGFESRASIMKDVIDALKDNHTNPVIICGMSGIGKTTMLKEIFKCEEAVLLFDEIVMVEVNRTDDYLRELQKEIADLLGLKCLSELTNLLARADALSRRLRSLSKKVLVILDDVCEDIDFEKVGIPLGEVCKVLISTRFQHLYSEVTTKKKFILHFLKEEEAWNLFKKMAGDSIESPELRPIAEQVLKKCDGLPIAISMMGKALRDKDESIWSDAIRLLENPSRENISEEEVITKLRPNIEFCYERLESEEAKSFFFLCCQYPEGSDVQVEDLVRHGLGLGLFKNIDSVVQGRNRVEALIDRLKDRSLLLDSYKAGCVKMHDLLRCVSVLLDFPAFHERNSTIKVRNRFFVRYGAELTNHWLRDIEASSSAELHNLKKSQFLLLSCTEDSAEAPEDILKVLDLKNANMVSVPSLPHFQSIQTLCLEHWKLGDVSIIGELRTLMILSLRHSSMNELPQSFRNLSNLWILDLTGSRILNFDIISSGIISSLRKLQELYILVHAGERFHDDFIERMHRKDYLIKWDAKKRDEVLSWQCRLTTLEVDLPEVSLEFRERCELFGGLERFNILIGFNVLNGECLQGLRSLKLKNGNTLENIGDDFFQHRTFPVLHSVKIRKSKMLVRICNSQPSMRLFEELRSIELYSDHNLRFVFPLSMARADLYQLEELIIQSCSNLEVIVASEGESKKENNEICKLPNLTQLNLEDLPDFVGFSRVNIGFPLLISIRLVGLYKLVTLCPSDSAPESSSSATIRHLFDTKDESLLELRLVEVIRCHSVSSMFSSNSMQSVQHLEQLRVGVCQSLRILFDFENPNVKQGEQASLTLSCIESMTLIDLPELEYVWRHYWNIQAFQNLITLKIGGCRKLKNVFPLYIAEGMVKLKNISVGDCEWMEEIICGNGRSREDETATTKKLAFAHVESLEFMQLRSLVRFCGAPFILEWPSLRKLVLSDLRSFRNLSAGVADSQSHAFSLQDESLLELRLVEVIRCDSVSSMFSSNSIESLQHLEQLRVEGCLSLRILFDFENLNIEHGKKASLTLSCIESMTLIDLPELEYVWRHYWNVQAFQNLVTLKIDRCWKLENVFPLYIAEGMVKLKNISVDDCESMKEIISGNGRSREDETVTKKKFGFAHVESLELTQLPSLVRFCGAPFILEWPSLRKLVLSGLDKIRNLSADVADSQSNAFSLQVQSFHELQFLEVSRCNSISRMFSSISPQNLQNLEHVNIERCRLLETVFETMTTKKMVFAQLKYMHLDTLHSLARICCALCIVECPTLRSLSLKRLSKFTIVSGDAGIPTHIFNEKVDFPALEELTIYNISGMEEIWSSQILPNSFSQLRKLCVDDCNVLSVVIPFHLQVNAPPSSGKLTPAFSNLTELEVNGCPRISVLLSHSAARGLVNLEKLTVRFCHMMKQIVSEPHQDNTSILPQLRYLKLDNLENLASFTAGSYNLDWPHLVEFYYQSCPRMETFCFGSIHTPELNRVEILTHRGLIDSLQNDDLNIIIQRIFKA